MRIAIITGASSGLGAEFARQIAKKEAPDELWLIARRGERLQALADALPVSCRVFAMDLTNPLQRRNFERTLRFEHPEITLLVNAAGFGKLGKVSAVNGQDNEDMIALNCTALTEMNRMCQPYLHRGSRVLNLASVSGFLPLSGFDVYASTKAYVLHFSRALREELRTQGVMVSAICPYWIHDTEFISVAKQTPSPNAVTRFPFAGRSEAIVALSLSASKKNLAVITPDVPSILTRAASKVLPRTPMIAIWNQLRR